MVRKTTPARLKNDRRPLRERNTDELLTLVTHTDLEVRMRWNELRSADDGFAPNFEGRVLNNLSFDGQNLRGAIFNQCTISNADFRDADLTNARFIEAVISLADPEKEGSGVTADFNRATLTGTTFHGATLKNVSLSNATIAEGGAPRFVRAILRQVVIEGTDLSGADFSGAKLQIRWRRPQPVRVCRRGLQRVRLQQRHHREDCGVRRRRSERMRLLRRGR